MVVLIILIALILAAPYVYQLLGKDSIINPKDFNNALAVLDKAKKSQGVTIRLILQRFTKKRRRVK
jgi:hypothetical protein